MEIDYRTIYLGNIASPCVLKTNDSEKKLKISGSEFRHNDQKTCFCVEVNNNVKNDRREELEGVAKNFILECQKFV